MAILLTLLSPLKEPTSEILARTRPNFFDLLIAVFSGVAGAYAVIRQGDDVLVTEQDATNREFQLPGGAVLGKQ